MHVIIYLCVSIYSNLDFCVWQKICNICLSETWHDFEFFAFSCRWHSLIFLWMNKTNSCKWKSHKKLHLHYVGSSLTELSWTQFNLEGAGKIFHKGSHLHPEMKFFSTKEKRRWLSTMLIIQKPWWLPNMQIRRVLGDKLPNDRTLIDLSFTY